MAGRSKQHYDDAGRLKPTRCYSMDNESIIGFEALYNSMNKCSKGVLHKNSAAYFYLHGIEECMKLEAELKSGSYKPRQTHTVRITYPKPREAVSIAFRDRVYQRSLNDNALYPNMTKSFIYENMACQKGKGTGEARAHLDRILHSYYINHGTDGYVLQCDVKGYYKSMSHTLTEGCFERHVPHDAYVRAKTVLQLQYSGDRGYAPGSQMVQIAGISYLDPLDHYIKEQLHIKYYLRYMDDFILIHHDREYLEHCRKQIELKLAELQLTLHPKKTRIYELEEGIKILGFTHRLTPTGKVIRIIDPKNVKSARKRLRRLVNLAVKGEISRPKADECYRSWKAHAENGNSYKLLQRMDKYYKSLWREYADN